MPSPPPVAAAPLAARLFLRRIFGFDLLHASIEAALSHHGYIQIDPINICGRMHDLILRNRVAGYREGDLMRHLHGGDDPAAENVDPPATPARPSSAAAREKQNPSSPASPAALPSRAAAATRRNTRLQPRCADLAPRNADPARRDAGFASRDLGLPPREGAPAPRHGSVAGTAFSLPAEARIAFEHHVPGTGILVAFPLEAWPHLLRAMHDRSRTQGAWAGRLTPREKVLAEQLLAEIALRGPLGSEDFDDDRRARRVWGAAKLVKATLQKLFFHGRLLIAQRQNNRRRYDLPERVLPAAVLALPEAPAGETARWLALLKLRQRRLVTLKREEFRQVEDAVLPVAVEGCPPLFCLREDAPLLELARAEAASAETRALDPARLAPRLLAPLDPLIYDRRVTAALWGFDYTWEAYTPPLKRVRGYYALPVLVGTEIVGHVDPKADRAQRRLVVVSRRIRRGHAIAPVLREFAQWLGLR